MITEERKFLDLDHVCDQIVSQDDRAMFNEAIQCYQIGSHRAAVILAWCVTADCLYRRIEELANEGDGLAQQARNELKSVMGQAVYEENLIAQAKKCELFDDYEEKCLRFARDTRSKCAHPTGVIPSAEAVRNIFFVCSQIVLCRDGYRGMSFIKQFVQSKLDDRHLFTDKNRIQEACRYYFGKVSERIRPQFAACSAEHALSGVSLQWKQNAFHFFRELIGNSSDELALKIAQKFQPIESIDRTLFSCFVGIDKRDHLWDGYARSQAKAHLRDSLKTGKIDSYEFDSYGNLCTLCDFEADDKDLFKERFSLIAEHISRHQVLIESRRSEILCLIKEAIRDEQYRQQIFKGIECLIVGDLFMQESEEIKQFIDELIESDWREESISNLFLMCSDWSNILKVYLLRKSERFLEECSEDFPDDIVQIFDAANSLIISNSSMLPREFEESIKRIIDGDQNVIWFDEKGFAFRAFVGQINLIKMQHGAHLPVLCTLVLPEIEPEELFEDE